MKRIIYCLTVILISVASLKTQAQNAFSELIKSAPGDATKLLDAYSQPLFKGFGVGLNSGWSNTAQTKKLLHFDFRITATGAFVPQSDKMFDVTKLGLSDHIRPADPSHTLTPTIAGDKNAVTPTLDVYDDNGQKVDNFRMPTGKIPLIPSPQLQLTMGLIKNTDITVRGVPKISFGGNIGNISMIGFGIKHDIIRDFAGKKADKLIPFDLAIALGYSHLNMSVPLNVQPDGAHPENNQQATDFTNQHLEGHFNSFVAQAIISKKLLFFTPFLALGYNTGHAHAAAIGNYPVTTGEDLAGPTYATFTNPITIDESSISGFRADFGFQLNLSVFRLYASYSAAEYQSFNAGFGFGF